MGLKRKTQEEEGNTGAEQEGPRDAVLFAGSVGSLMKGRRVG